MTMKEIVCDSTSATLGQSLRLLGVAGQVWCNCLTLGVSLTVKCVDGEEMTNSEIRGLLFSAGFYLG